MPKPNTSRKAKPFYKSSPPKSGSEQHGVPPSGGSSSTDKGPDRLKAGHHTSPAATRRPSQSSEVGHVIAPSHFELREDGSIAVDPKSDQRAPSLVFSDEARRLWLYQGNCLELLDAVYAKYGEAGRFDCIFADPPYFLSNGGITCHAGKMVKVDKGDWDKSRGADLNHEFNVEWLRRCQRVLKPNGTIWVSGTHHVIFSIGYAMQQLGFKILNDIAWEKPNPPPNLSCRYFTHSTETILWAAKNDKSKHVFNYAAMKAVTGKQMKTVWTMTAPRNEEKSLGKHPTQKPIALVERCILASTNEAELVLDPFVGSGTTAVACVRLKRGFVGIETSEAYVTLAVRRTDRETVLLWLREFRVRVEVWVSAGFPRPREWDLSRAGSGERNSAEQKAQAGPSERARASHWVVGDRVRAGGEKPINRREPQNLQIDLDLDSRSMDRISGLKESEPMAECIFHETKFVFLSCAAVSSASVVHTTVDISLQEAWAKTPTGKKRETTHVVRCETEILRMKSS